MSDGESERVVSRTEGPFSTSTLAVVWKVDGMGEMRQGAPSGACSVVWEKDEIEQRLWPREGRRSKEY